MKRLAIILALLLAAPLAQADFVQRDLGRDAEGRPVVGYVFDSKKSSLSRRSGLAPRRPIVRSSRGRYYHYPIPVFYGSRGVCRSVYVLSGPRQGPFTVRILR